MTPALPGEFNNNKKNPKTHKVKGCVKSLYVESQSEVIPMVFICEFRNKLQQSMPQYLFCWFAARTWNILRPEHI